MRNVPITGGRTFGPPKGWDPDKQGECLSVSVLQTNDNGQPSVTTAWAFDEAERKELADGGVLFLSTSIPIVPLQRIWVQDADGDIVSDLEAGPEGVKPVSVAALHADRQRAVEIAGALRAAVLACGKALEQRLGYTPTDWTALDNIEAVRRFAATVETVPQGKPRGGMVQLPIKRLSDIAREGRTDGVQITPAMFGWPVDQALQDQIKRELGGDEPPAKPSDEPA